MPRAVAWSYGLLPDVERRAPARVAVFPAGATVAVAEGVIGAGLDTLQSLVAKQLLVRRDDRLVMLETVRQYALERLAEDPEGDTVRVRLARWCGERARETTLRRASRSASQARLDAESAKPKVGKLAWKWSLCGPRAGGTRST